MKMRQKKKSLIKIQLLKLYKKEKNKEKVQSKEIHKGK